MSHQYEHATHRKTEYMQSNKRPNILTIAGNDSSGLAGIQRDTQTIVALGGHAKTVISACTAQNSNGVQSINPVSDEIFAEQLKAQFHPDSKDKHPVNAIKIGLVASENQINLIKELCPSLGAPIVVDPVLAASSGEAFTNDSLLEHYRSTLLPVCTLITPNLDEASLLINSKSASTKVSSFDEIEAAAKALVALGAEAVLIKGGHQTHEGEPTSKVHDFFYSEKVSFWLSSERVDTQNSRGTGCALASSIATALGLGYTLEDAVTIGKMAINEGLNTSYAIEGQAGPVNVTRFPDTQDYLPCVSQKNFLDTEFSAFPPCTLANGEDTALGLYPVVDSSEWIARLLPQGIDTIQLRCKTLTGDALEKEIQQAVAIADKYNARLFINDYWELAIKYKAYGVHLGQEDLDDADVLAIQKAGLRLGTSTHCHYEVARAHTYRPSYIACGPVFHTDTKKMPWVPHGQSGFHYWRSVLTYPMVAIGGINETRIQTMLEAGADSVAMITAITLAENPEAAAKRFSDQVRQYLTSS